MRPLTIGLTGGIGSGKSTAARVLGELGAEIVSGDELGRLALESSPERLQMVRERFGPDIFAPDGRLLRRELGKRVFARAEDARWLTDLTFKDIHRRWREAVEHCRREVIVFDAALIFEWGIEREFDLLIVISSSPDRLAERARLAGRWSGEEAEARLAAQLPLSLKVLHADVHIENNSTIVDLENAIRSLWDTRIEPELRKRRETGNEPLH